MSKNFHLIAILLVSLVPHIIYGEKNVTRLQVQPPATSSLTDRLNAVLQTSDATPTQHTRLKEELESSSSTEEEDTEEEDLEDLSTCGSCGLDQERLVQRNLKKILHKLGLNQPPNMTQSQLPQVHYEIVERFIKEYKIKPNHVNLNQLSKGLGASYAVSHSDDFFMNDEGMQGDDPNMTDEYDDDSMQKEVYDEEDDDYFPITERIYVFAKSK